ncbi:MAG: WD40 repeat domain-containing protein, partial [Planctomycetales bacterium]|nr:WD40 repeat domain-containing protein [Planctomycetales bacterium]
RLASVSIGEQPISRACWSPDGKWLAFVDQAHRVVVVSTDRPDRKMDVALSYPGRPAGSDDIILDLAFSDDSQHVLVSTSNFGVQLLRVRDDRLDIRAIKRPTGRTWRATFVPESDLLALWASQRSDIYLYHREDGAFVKRVGTQGELGSLQAGPRETLMLIQRRAAQTGYEPPSSQVLSLYPTLATAELLGGTTRWRASAWSPEGDRIASIDVNGEVSLWRARSRADELRRADQSTGPPMPHALRVTDQAVAHTIRSLGSVVSLDRQGRVRSTHVGTGATAADGTFPYADPAIPAIVVRAGWSGSVGADGIAAGIAQLFGPSGTEPFRTHQGAAEYTWGSWLASRDIYLLMDQDYRIEARGREDGELIWRSPLTDSVSLDRISPYSDTLLLTPLDSAPRLVEFNAEGAAESQFDLPGSSQMRATDVVWLPDGDQMLVIFDYTLIARGSRGTRTMQWIGRLMTPIQELTVAGDGQSLAWQLRAQRGVPPTVFSSIDVLPPNNEPAPPAGEGPFDLGQIADLPVIELGEPTTAANVVMALGGQSRFALFTFGEGVKLGGLDQDEEVLFEGVAMATATSEDGKQLVLVDTRPIVGRQSFLFAGSPTFGERQQRQTIITFDVGPGQAEESSRVEWIGGLVRDIDFGADGWVLFCEDYGVELETLAGPQAGKRLRLGRHAAFVSQLVALPGNRWVTGSFDHSVQVWDGETGQSLGTAWELDASVIALEPSPDGRRLAIGTANGQMLLVDPSQPDQPALEVELSDEPRRLVWRESGDLVAILKSGDWIEVSSTGQIQAEKKLGGGWIANVELSPDQRFVSWIASDTPPMPIPGLPPGPQRLFLAAIDDLEGAEELPIPDAASTGLSVRWTKGEGIDTLLAFDNGTLYRLQGTGPQATWSSVATLPEATDWHVHQDRVALVGATRFEVIDLGDGQKTFQLNSLLASDAFLEFRDFGETIGFHEPTKSWWVIERSGGVVEIPDDLVEQAMESAERFEFE